MNQLLDSIASKFLLSAKGYDEDGQIASSYFIKNGGHLTDDVEPPDPELVEYTEHVRRSMEMGDCSRSLGTEDCPAKWLDLVETSLGQQHGAFIAYHACQHIAKRISTEVRIDLQREGSDGTCHDAIAVVAGGGARNKLLFSMLQAYFGDLEVVKSCDVGARVGVQDRESISMAVLGYLCGDHDPLLCLL